MRLPPKIKPRPFDRADLKAAMRFGKHAADAREMRDQGYPKSARQCAAWARQSYEQITAKHEGVAG